MRLYHSHEGSYRQDTGKNMMPKSTSMGSMCLVVVVRDQFTVSGVERLTGTYPPLQRVIFVF
jgi:hypothetical protein